MVTERVPAPIDGTLRGLGDALRRAIPLVAQDHEERAERHELRKIELREAVRR